MKMLSDEEKIDSKVALRLVSFIILLFPLANTSYSQIPINGFINFTEVNFIPQQNKIFSLNFNKDAYSDLLIFNQDNKNTFLLAGQPNNQFTKPQQINFRFEPNFFKPVYDNQNQILEYAFTSRRSKMFGLIKFNKFGYPRLTNSIKLNSFPNKIDLADVDLDFSTDYLISGLAFDGLSIISKKNNSLIENKLFKNLAFIDAYFYDINLDEYIDILAYDAINEKLMFIYNKDGKRFSFERELKVNHKVNKFQIFDLNFDANKELIFSTDIGLIIYFSDKMNLFKHSVIIKTNSSIDNFTIGDYNHDGFFDFICHSSSNDYLSIIFSKDDDEFYDEIIFESEKQIIDLIPFYSRFVYGVAYLSSDGKIKIISEFRSFSKDVNFIYSLMPTSIKTIDFNNDGILDFAYLDKFDNRLKFILRNMQGVPSTYFYVDLKGDHTETFILQNASNKFSVYCYSLNQRLIEILDIDFDNFKFKKEILYTEGKIQDLSSKNVDGVGKIKILYSKDNKLNYAVLRLSIDKKYKLVKYPLVSENFRIANIFSDDEDKVIFWSKVDSLFTLRSVNYLFDTKVVTTIFSDYYKDIIRIYNCIQKQIKNSDYFSSLIQTSDKKYLLIFSPDFKILINSDLLTDYSLLEKKPLVSDSDGFAYFFDNQFNKVFRIIYVKRLNKILLRNVFDEVNLSEFVVDRLDKINNHLIFIDSKDNKIKIRQLY